LNTEATRLDDAARAGWLYYVAGNTQDEIARKLGVSRQSAQRLVAMAVTERLVKVRIDHPIGRCMDLARQLSDRFNLTVAEVVPSDPDAPELLTGVAIAAAAVLERVLRSEEPRIIALGTGRALKATVEQLSAMTCPQHRIVSRLGNMMSDGSATPYNAVVRMADRVGARHYPYPLPVLARDSAELTVLHAQEAVRSTLSLCAEADITLVGIGQIGPRAPLVVDGFLSVAEAEALTRAGATGEITSWIYDRDGRVMDCAYNTRVASAPVGRAGDRPMIAVAVGQGKVAAIRAALRGRLVNGLITSEATAEAILSA
jgi:DNA-binding transcriptional regulator LsrR (DeoR family)